MVRQTHFAVFSGLCRLLLPGLPLARATTRGTVLHVSSELAVWERAFAAAEMKNDLVMSLRRAAVRSWRTRIEDFLESISRLLGKTPDAYRSLLVDLALDIGHLAGPGPAGTLPGPTSRPATAVVVDPAVEDVRNWLLEQVKESLISDAKENLSLVTDARCPSRREPSRRTGQIAGTPTGRRVNRIRARRAAALLSAGVSVETAASLVGYENSAAFYPVFHGVFGCSPADYRSRTSTRHQTARSESRPSA